MNYMRYVNLRIKIHKPESFSFKPLSLIFRIFKN